MPFSDDLLLIRSLLWGSNERLWYINFCTIKIDSAIKSLKGCQVMWPHGNVIDFFLAAEKSITIGFMASSFGLGMIKQSFATVIIPNHSIHFHCALICLTWFNKKIIDRNSRAAVTKHPYPNSPRTSTNTKPTQPTNWSLTKQAKSGKTRFWSCFKVFAKIYIFDHDILLKFIAEIWEWGIFA